MQRLRVSLPPRAEIRLFDWLSYATEGTEQVAQPSGPPPSTPNFPAAPSYSSSIYAEGPNLSRGPSTPNSPIPLDFEYERGSQQVLKVVSRETGPGNTNQGRPGGENGRGVKAVSGKGSEGEGGDGVESSIAAFRFHAKEESSIGLLVDNKTEKRKESLQSAAYPSHYVISDGQPRQIRLARYQKQSLAPWPHVVDCSL
ncbi:unnamed protein product [Symbiodinium microadriaticum]|nr:unnamed protein product [Symbiodinium microadriaticum]